ncbi:MAG: addiction module protein [Xanthomonadales bacterium]|jgi:hypothetical protein|nr:addiction module protein [Xanthomonadales bacterium]
MSESARELLHQAIQLPAHERAVLADELLASLGSKDSAIDAAWLKEAESRLAAWQRGDVEALDATEVFAELGKPA